jgi:tetratricopeptide (TPR) repeat protein
MAERFKIEVPADVERFFAAVEVGNWDEIDAAFKPIGERYKAEPQPRDIGVLWGPILEALGAAESAHEWPAQRLLDYGESVLGSLRPGMVYVGGTDPGRFIPTLLNETSDGEPHVIITQNGLAASSYVDYLNFLYGDRLATLTHEDSNRAFQDYYSDFQRRLEHDREFPNEPRQVLPGENSNRDLPRPLTSQDGLVEITGVTATMAVNERLLQMLLQKNPELSFALEESFPLKSTYADATLLGPITEIRARDPEYALTAERAAQSVEYWRGVAEQFRINPDESEEAVAFKTYSKLAVAQANLFADRNFTAEAEQAYRIANQIYPANVEAVTGLVGILMRSGRELEANQILDQFSRDHPNQRRAVETFRGNLAPPTGQPVSSQR